MSVKSEEREMHPSQDKKSKKSSKRKKKFKVGIIGHILRRLKTKFTRKNKKYSLKHAKENTDDFSDDDYDDVAAPVQQRRTLSVARLQRSLEHDYEELEDTDHRGQRFQVEPCYVNIDKNKWNTPGQSERQSEQDDALENVYITPIDCDDVKAPVSCEAATHYSDEECPYDDVGLPIKRFDQGLVTAVEDGIYDDVDVPSNGKSTGYLDLSKSTSA